MRFTYFPILQLILDCSKCPNVGIFILQNDVPEVQYPDIKFKENKKGNKKVYFKMLLNITKI
jgi:hypothetical protein